MSIYTIADLHLSFETNKPMDIFGVKWENHIEKIEQDWIKKVKQEDLVILGGDFSWATYIEETYKDFEFLNNLPGKKILLKGNHDYWWTTVTSMRRYLIENEFENIDFLLNNSYIFDDKIITGTRGWSFETMSDKKVLQREVNRLESSIKDGIEKFGDKEIIVFMHYPPLTRENQNTDFVKIMMKYGVKKCYYGHLHGESINQAVEGNVNNIEFKLISADGLDFKLIKI